MKKSVLLLILGIFFLINFVSATSVGTSDMTEGRVVYTPPVFINYSIITTNSSNYWGDHFYTDYDLLVPYTGADKNVDLGDKNLTTIGKGEFGDLAVVDGGILAVGTTGSTPVSGAGTRLMWIPAKKAFRAGAAYSTYWDDEYIGSGSFAFGSDRTYAFGTGGIAMGYNAHSNYDHSIAIGRNTAATGGAYSLVVGDGSKTTEGSGTAIGISSEAGYRGVAVGFDVDVYRSVGVGGGIDINQGNNYITAMGYTLSADTSIDRSVMVGRFLTTSADSASLIGSGVDSDNPLVNSIPNSIAFAVNSTVPTLFITDGGGVGGIGNVGIGTLTPTHKLNVVGNANITGNITTNQYYAEMWFHNESASGNSTTISSQDVWYNITGFSQATDSGQSLNGFSYSGHQLTCNIAGLYKADYSISFGGGLNDEYKTSVGVNSIPQNNTETHRKLGSGGDVGNTGSSGFISLSANDIVTLMILNDDAAANADVHSANLNLVRVGN